MAGRTVQIVLSLSRQEQKLIDNAAAFRCWTPNEFAVATLVAEAKKVIANPYTITLSARGFKQLLEILEEDTEPTPFLRRAVRRHAAMIGPSQELDLNLPHFKLHAKARPKRKSKRATAK